jgi:hypothetical protein
MTMQFAFRISISPRAMTILALGILTAALAIVA